MFGMDKAPEQNVFAVGMQAFSRAGAWFGLVARPRHNAKPQDQGRLGASELWLATARGGAAWHPTPDCIRLCPAKDGQPLNFTVASTPTELTLKTAYGAISLCFPEPSLLLVHGADGLELELSAQFGLLQVLHPRGQRSFESTHSNCCCFVYTPLTGTLEMNAPWEMNALSTPRVRGLLRPDGTGELLLAVSESVYRGIERERFPGWEEGLAAVRADWEAFLSAFPEREGREKAAFQLWSNLCAPSHLTAHTQLQNRFGQSATSYQSSLAAAALADDAPLGAQLLLAQCSRQSPEGQIPASCSDTCGLLQTVTPPAQGIALKRLLARGAAECVERKDLERLFASLEALSRWYDERRCDCALPQYESAGEAAYPGSPVFASGPIACLPDLCAFLALLDEALGDLAGALGRTEKREALYARSRRRIGAMLREYWNGARFVGKTHDGRVIDTESLIFYRPLMLGDRLPKEVASAMAEDLGEGNGFLCGAGFLTQRLTSAAFDRLKPCGGGVSPIETAMIADGLRRAGFPELAACAAGRCRDALLRPASPFWPIRPGFPDAETAAAFRLLTEIAT